MEKAKSVPFQNSARDYARLHAILDSLKEGVLMYDLNGAVIEANQAALDFLSAATKEAIKLTRKDLDATYAVSTLDGTPVPVEHWPVWRILQGEEVVDAVLQVRNKHTGRRWISSHSGRPVKFPENNEVFAVLSIRDITDGATAERQVRENEARLKSAFDSFVDQVMIVDHHLRPRYLNPAAIQAGISGSIDATDGFWRAVAHEAIAGAKPVMREVRHNAERGTREYIVNATPLLNAAGGVDEVVVLAHDATEQRQAQERVRQAALQDPLTGLPNRTMLYEYAQHMFAAAKRQHRQVAVLFIDLDRFKPVNDIYGHEVGDQLLCALAERLRSRIRGEDLITRFGGDEFVILLSQVDEHSLPHAIAADLIRLIGRPVRINELDLTVEACIGISVFPHDGETLDVLIQRADAAMYLVKQSGRNDYRFYTEEMAFHAVMQSHIEHELKRAIAKGELSVLYQPIVDIDSGKIVCAEALTRWDGSIVSPDVFVPIAETSGLIGRMTDWVLDEICRQHHAWRQQGLPTIPVSINVSPVQFKLRSFIEDLELRLREQDIPAHALQIELTETAVMWNVEHAICTIRHLREHGIKVALDDFGKGYSSLSYLSRLPIDKIKIDKEFIIEIDTHSANRAITDAIIALGNALQLEVIAEGVESREVLCYLRQQGCRQAQGFYFSMPVTGQAFAKFLADGRIGI